MLLQQLALKPALLTRLLGCKKSELVVDARRLIVHNSNAFLVFQFRCRSFFLNRQILIGKSVDGKLTFISLRLVFLWDPYYRRSCCIVCRIRFQ